LFLPAVNGQLSRDPAGKKERKTQAIRAFELAM
jgi:hypothetical protein